MLYTKRKKYSGRWIIKLIEAALVFGIVFFGLDLLGQFMAPSVSETVIVVQPVQIEGATLNVDNNMERNLNAQLDAVDYFYLALDHQMSGAYYDAVADYSNAIELDPDIAPSWLNRGVAYEQLGRDTLAMFDFNHFLTRDNLVVLEGSVIRESVRYVETMSLNYRYDVPMDLYTGQVVDISVRSVEEDQVDPIIVLVNEDGVPVAANDDVRRQDGSLISMNSYIDNFEVDESGEYTLMVSHAGGGSYGDFVIRIDIDS